MYRNRVGASPVDFSMFSLRVADESFIRRIVSYKLKKAVWPFIVIVNRSEYEGYATAFDLDPFCVQAKFLGDTDCLGAAGGENGAFHVWIYISLFDEMSSFGVFLSSYRDLMI
jgi:hypothetical protein